MRLKEREKEVLHWDDKLTLEFNGSRPAVCALEITPATNAITVFLLGDSTVTDQPREPWNSWGQMLTRFFQPGVAVANHAESGESLKSSLGAHRVQKVLSSIKPGDYLFIQYGHNDQKDRATNALATYKTNLLKLVADARARGATPVLVTSMERTSGVDKDTLGEYPATVAAGGPGTERAAHRVARHEPRALPGARAGSEASLSGWHAPQRLRQLRTRPVRRRRHQAKPTRPGQIPCGRPASIRPNPSRPGRKLQRAPQPPKFDGQA